MKRSNLAAALYLFLVLLSGVLLGGFGHRLYTSYGVSAKTGPTGPEEYRRKYIEEMRMRLNLREEQVRQLNVILDATRTRYRALREKYGPEMKMIHQEQVEKTRAILDDAQRAEYEKLREEREQRRRQSQGHSPGC